VAARPRQQVRSLIYYDVFFGSIYPAPTLPRYSIGAFRTASGAASKG
jgi:hypothetical protein